MRSSHKTTLKRCDATALMRARSPKQTARTADRRRQRTLATPCIAAVLSLESKPSITPRREPHPCLNANHIIIMETLVVATTASPALDLESSPVQGQLASAVLDLQGNLVRGQLSPHDASILFQMLQETSNLQDLQQGFKRITVTYSAVRYIVARDESHVYIVQTRAG